MFSIAAMNVFIMMLYICPGFILCKVKKALPQHLSSISALLLFVCSPCLVVSSFINTDYSIETVKNMGIFFLLIASIQILFLVIMFLVFKRKYEDSRFPVLTISTVVGNVGYFGSPVVAALFPDKPEAVVYSMIFSLSMNMIIFSLGVFFITGDRKFVSLKSIFINPAVLSTCVGFPLFLLGAKDFLPVALVSAITLVGKMSAPVCMFILGVRLGASSLKTVFLQPLAYLSCFIKLIIFPLFAYACVCFLPVDETIKGCVLVLSSAPCASMVLALAELHHAKAEFPATCVLLSTLLCFLTIPLLVLIL